MAKKPASKSSKKKLKLDTSTVKQLTKEELAKSKGGLFSWGDKCQERQNKTQRDDNAGNFGYHYK